MATLRVRYRDGSEDVWNLHERGAPLNELARTLHERNGREASVAFGVESRSEKTPDYAFVGLRMNEVVMWEIDGFLDEEFLASVWEPKQP